ncbi:hypothetical protein D3C80_2049750 [compost metagenome]
MIVPDESVEDGYELSSDGDDSDELWLSLSDEAVTEGFEGWIVARGNECAHVERRSDCGAASADKALAAPLAGLTCPGSKAD